MTGREPREDIVEDLWPLLRSLEALSERLSSDDSVVLALFRPCLTSSALVNEYLVERLRVRSLAASDASTSDSSVV